jgi:hypothetical protein
MLLAEHREIEVEKNRNSARATEGTRTHSLRADSLTGSASSTEVKTDYDRNADFGRYKTYSWGKVQTPNALWVDRIKAVVTSALAEKGWTEVESGGDVSIMAMEMNENHRTLNT